VWRSLVVSPATRTNRLSVRLRCRLPPDQDR
jgi:hypothetical protein